jgi:hypothetical protein
MGPLGDFDASAVIYGKFATYRPSTGATFTLAGSPVLSVYKDNSTTQSTTGVTLTVDFDTVTGFNHFAIDTSADGTFYSAGSFFDVVITTGTVDSVSVTGSVVGSFTIRKNSSLKPTTAGRTLVVDASGLGDANTVKLGPSGSGTAQTARDIGASVLLSSGTGTGQLSITSGVVNANATQFAGQTITAAAGVTIPSSIASPTNITAGTITTVTTTTTATNLTNAPTAGDFTATMKTSLNAATPAVTVSDKTGFSLSVGGVTAVATGVWATVMEGSYTALQYMRGFGSAMMSILSGAATTTVVIRDTGNTKDRITATVDANGNRSAVTLDLT